ncbi:LiaF domain-containing protein, partial [Dietzia sp.]|uniref:LiaF domain-containing protein n=1 Tax=Dietzia sp. TaxID=1871616 RepID=UPI002FD97561
QVGRGRLTLAEFSDLSARIWEATAGSELEAVLSEADVLPKSGTPMSAADAADQVVVGRHSEPAVVIEDDGPIRSWFDDVERKGRWDLTTKVEVAAYLGDIFLDLREAIIDSEVSELSTHSVLGDTRILVPPGVRVVLSGNRIMGSLKTDEGNYASPTGPTIRIKADSFMGDVKIRVLAGGEKIPKTWKWF